MAKNATCPKERRNISWLLGHIMTLC